MPPSTKVMAKLETASKLYEDFTGHPASHLKQVPGSQRGVFLEVGHADFLLLSQGNTQYQLDFPKNTLLIVPYTAKRFDIIGQSDIKPDNINFRGKPLILVEAIAYTTKRDGKTEKYIHRFKKHARPTINYQTRKHLNSLGGGFEFTELGFVDNP